MKTTNLPAIYQMPTSDDDIVLARDLLDAAREMPAHRTAILFAVNRILGPATMGTVAPHHIPSLPAPTPSTPRRTRKKAIGEADRAAPESPLKPKDVAVDLTAEAESVTFRGKAMEVTADQALLVQAIVAALPAPVDRKTLQKAVYPKRKGDSGKFALNTLIAPTREALAGVGLELRTLRGVGLGIWPAESK